MSLLQTVKAFDAIADYPDLQEYIKTFNSPRGFMYTVETDPKRKACEKQLEDLLNANGMHSGASWGCMLRSIQAVLTGGYA